MNKETLIAQFGIPEAYRLRTFKPISGIEEKIHILVFSDEVIFVDDATGEFKAMDQFEPLSSKYYPIVT